LSYSPTADQEVADLSGIDFEEETDQVEGRLRFHFARRRASSCLFQREPWRIFSEGLRRANRRCDKGSEESGFGV